MKKTLIYTVLKIFSLSLLIILKPFCLSAQDKAISSENKNTNNKSNYTLFDPIPEELMREMSTDRPDTTESPYTVDAGHFQLEMSFIDYEYNNDTGIKTNTINIAPLNLKIGLLNNVDIQFIFTPEQYVGTKAGNEHKTSIHGFGDDTQIRLKTNIWGNDGGETAFALMPFIKFPTGTKDLSNNHVEGGLILPLAVSLPGNWDMGLMAETDFVYYDETTSYGVDFVHTLTVGHDIPVIENLGGYLEYVGIQPDKSGIAYQGILSTGLTYAVTGNIQLDCGGTYGLTKDTDDFRLFMGISIRQ